VEVKQFGGRGPAGAEGVQQPGCRAGGRLVGSFAPVIKAEKPSMPDLNSSAAIYPSRVVRVQVGARGARDACTATVRVASGC